AERLQLRQPGSLRRLRHYRLAPRAPVTGEIMPKRRADNNAVFRSGLARFHQPALAHRVGEIAQERHAVLPADARVGQALAVGQRLAGNQILAPGLEVRLDHHAEDAVLPRGDLPADLARDVDLPLIHLLAVRVAAVDHQALLQARPRELLRRRLDAAGVVVRVL